MEAALMQALLASAALVDLVGGSAAPRIFWDEAPERAPRPWLILQKVASVPFSHTMKGRTPTTEDVVQADAEAGSKAAALEIRDAYLAAVDTLKTRPLMVFPEARRSDRGVVPGPDATGSTRVCRESVDARVWHFPTAA